MHSGRLDSVWTLLVSSFRFLKARCYSPALVLPVELNIWPKCAICLRGSERGCNRRFNLAVRAILGSLTYQTKN